nr:MULTISPECIES: YbaN family protein [unclassified Pannonibacter]
MSGAQHVRRTAYKLAGLAFVVTGLVGAVLPLLPSTIFFILAAAMFARSSPELEARILAHPTIGPQVIAWRDHGVIPPRAKLLAVGGMAAGYAVFVVLGEPAGLTAGLVAAAILACAAYVLSRPSRPQA